MTDFDDLIGENINDFCEVVNTFGRRQVAALEMGVAMKVITWLGHADEPVDGL
jgi:hypothetical protein